VPGATVTTRWWGASVTAAASRGDGVATATLLATRIARTFPISFIV
jgi:hypothetical protein